MMAEQELGKDFTVILPTLNEGDNIGPMIESLASLYPRSAILVVDDNSADGTVYKASNSPSARDRVKVITRDPKDKGLTASIMEGIMNTRTPYFVVLDADFQHPVETIAKFMRSLKGGSDLVVGTREDKMSMVLQRKLASSGANSLAKLYLRAKRQPYSKDTMSGFFGGRTGPCQA